MKKLILWFLQGRYRYDFDAGRNGYVFGVSVGISCEMSLECALDIRLVDTFHKGEDGMALIVQPGISGDIQFFQFYFSFYAMTKRYYL
jgi:hypothetical protein